VPASDPDVRRAIARKAALSRWGGDTGEADRDLATDLIASYIEKVVSQAPPLSQEQVARLTQLIRTQR
jgi:hypothetical protein